MSFVEIKGKQVEVDEDGFIVEPEMWNVDIAEYFAAEEDVAELTEQHWKIINYLKDYFKQFGIAPMVRKVCKDNGISMQELHVLFPTGPAQGACKIAGLPKPTGCV